MKTTINGQAYLVSDGRPVYPSMKDTHIFGSGITLELDSTDPYATHSFNNAIVNLTDAYSNSLPAILGVFPHPVKYNSIPHDDILSQTWSIGKA